MMEPVSTPTKRRRRILRRPILLISLAATTILPVCYGQGEILTPEIMNMAVLAAEVSVLTYDTIAATAYLAHHPLSGTVTDTIAYQGGLYVKEPDVAIAARVDNTCVMAFRGTSRDIFQATWLDDVDTNFEDRQEVLLESCTVTQGIYNAYFTQYWADLENDVRSCLSNCPDCNLLITGHSQGGAIANAAGVLFESYGYSPYVVTFGQPNVLGGECRVNAWKWFRFIHAIPGLVRLQYDIVPMVRGSGYYYGHEIVVSSDDDTGVDYVGINQHVDKRPWNVPAHFSDGYLATMTALHDNGAQLRTTGFRSGAQCTTDAECSSGSCGWKWWDAAYECG